MVRLHQIEIVVGDPRATARRMEALVDADAAMLPLTLRHGERSRRGPDGLRVTGPTHLCIQGGDIDALAARLAGGGWRAFGAPTGLGGSIRYQYAEDDDGLIVEAESVPSAAADATPWLAHVALATPDRDRLLEWYAALTETTPRRSPRLGPSPQIAQLTGMAGVEVSGAWLPAGALEIEFWTWHAPAPRAAPRGPLDALVFAANDLASEVARLREHGFVIGADGASTRDPDGNVVRLIERAA